MPKRFNKFIIGVALCVQAFSCLIMFLILCTRKKSISAAFLAVAAMEGVAGAYMLKQYKDEENEFLKKLKDEIWSDDDFDLDEDVLRDSLADDDEDIQVDTEATEADFN